MINVGSHTLANIELEPSNHCILLKLTDSSAKYIHEITKYAVSE